MAESQERNITSGLSYQYMSSIAFVASGGVFYVFMAKFLQTSEVGEVSLVLAIASLLNIVFSFSLPTSAQHFISYYKGRGDETEMRSLTKRFVLISLLLSAASIAFTLVLARPLAIVFFHNPAHAVLIEVGAALVTSMIMFGVLHGSALGLQLFRTDAIVYLSSGSLSYLVGLVFFSFFHGISFLIVGLTLSYLWGSIIYAIIIFTRKPPTREKSRLTSLGQIFSYSWPLILSSLIGYGSQYLDRFVVAYFLDISTLGIYSFVLIVGSSLSFLANPIANIMIPKLSEFFSGGEISKMKKGLDLSSAVLTLIYSPLALGAAAIAPVVLSILARTQYESGDAALTILLGISSIFVLGNIVSSVVSAVRRTRVYILSTAFTLASNVALSFLLIPRYGMIGAAIANSSVMVISFFVLYYYAIVKEIGSFDWASVLKIWSSSLLMFIVVSLERMFVGNGADMLPLFTVTGGLVYLVALNLTRSLGRFNREEFLSYIPVRFRLRNVASIFLGRAF